MRKLLLALCILAGAVAIQTTSADAATSNRCRALAPVVARHFPPGVRATMLRIAWRESGCGRVLHAYRARTRDNSYGPFMLNRWGRLGAVYSRAGFSASRMATVEGGTAAAAWLYKRCGLGPWVRPYSCRGR